MDDKRPRKRSKTIDEKLWKCSICTYENVQEAYSCEICETRKGTSTRKPKASVALTQQFNTNTQTTSIAKERKVGRSFERLSKINTAMPIIDSQSSFSHLELSTMDDADASNGIDQPIISPKTSIEHEINDSPPIPQITEPKPVRHSLPRSPRKRTRRPPRHKNVDRSTAVRTKITVNGVTVQFIDYKPKKHNSANDSTINPEDEEDEGLEGMEKEESQLINITTENVQSTQTN